MIPARSRVERAALRRLQSENLRDGHLLQRWRLRRNPRFGAITIEPDRVIERLARVEGRRSERRRRGRPAIAVSVGTASGGRRGAPPPRSPPRRTPTGRIRQPISALERGRTLSPLKGPRATDGSGASKPSPDPPGAGAPSEPGLELVGAGGPLELPRQDSNLRPVA